MKWNEIPGWTDDGLFNTYRRAVDEAEDGAVFVEIGAWLGKSTAYMVQQIINYGKDIKFYVVDTWDGGNPYSNDYESVLKTTPNHNIYHLFLKNMKECGFLKHIIPIMLPSMEAVNLFDDESVDFVYIDGNHFYSPVFCDIVNWYKKVKKGGIIAGHDYGNNKATIGADLRISTEIRDAVNAALAGKKFTIDYTSYVCRVV